MRVLLLLLLFMLALPSFGAEFQVNVTIPDGKLSDVLDLVDAYLDTQLQEDGTPKYSNRQDFARHLFAGALWQVLRNQCMADVPNCPAWAKNHLDDRVNADLQFESEIRDAVQPVAP